METELKGADRRRCVCGECDDGDCHQSRKTGSERTRIVTSLTGAREGHRRGEEFPVMYTSYFVQ